MKKMTKKLFLCLVAILVAVTLVSCGEETPEVEKVYTYNTYTSLSPSNWNELTYQDANDTQIMSYIGSAFFTYDFKFDANGEIVPGEFEMQYSAATKLEDITSTVDAKWGVPADGKGYAYRITLRDDLKWENGDPIKAEDFVYTMEQQLDPAFKNYRADSFYVGGTIIKGAKEFAKQGESGLFAAVDVYGDNITSLEGLYFDATNVSAFASIFGTADMTQLADYKAYFQVGDTNIYDELVAYAGDARTPMTKELSDKLAGLFGANGMLGAYWIWADAEIGYFTVTEYTYPEMDFSEVGIYAESDTELVIVLEKALPLLKEDGSLSYQAAYNMSSLPLVHKATYEANKVEPTDGNTLWTSTYNSSKETTMSWGPYKLESFESGKEYVLVKNENWYGFNMEEYKGQYQTDRIVCETIKEWNSAWVKFLAGEIDGIGIDVTVADEYKGSAQAYFTPSDFVGSLQLQSSKEGLKARESEGVNKSILSYVDFRKALSLAINRAEFANKTTTSSLKGFGLFNSMHYYDVENGGVYRNTDEAKKVLCEIYNVDPSKYASLDEAVNAITGYDLPAAKELVTKAYNEALAAGDIKETDKVVLTMGSGAINATVERRYNFIKESWVELVKGTPLEGRLEVELKDFSTAWANDFRAGNYDVCMGGWTGAAWDPGYFLLAYLSPDYMYSMAWDTSSQQLEFTMKGVAEDGGDITDTMSLLEWYDCLNGASGAKYDFSSNTLEESQRLQLIAALEKEVLKVYYTVPLYNEFGASLISYKVDYITYEYNTFLSYGGIRYMTYNYSDAEWEAEIAKVGGEFNYK
ncbi:MAG: hypothetical protein IJX78_03570 [Bacilli bacterium]|nr:hypothetical protein [Bacilli bacterium]